MNIWVCGAEASPPFPPFLPPLPLTVLMQMPSTLRGLKGTPPRRKKPSSTAKTLLKTPTMVVVSAELLVVHRKSE